MNKSLRCHSIWMKIVTKGGWSGWLNHSISLHQIGLHKLSIWGCIGEDTITTLATFFLQTVVPQKGQKFCLDTLVSQCIYECNVQTRVSKFYESSVLTPLVDYPFELENEDLVGNCLLMYVNIPPRLMLLNKYCMNFCYSTLEMKGYNYR